jgi:hypothetical protein
MIGTAIALAPVEVRCRRPVTLEANSLSGSGHGPIGLANDRQCFYLRRLGAVLKLPALATEGCLCQVPRGQRLGETSEIHEQR